MKNILSLAIVWLLVWPTVAENMPSSKVIEKIHPFLLEQLRMDEPQISAFVVLKKQGDLTRINASRWTKEKKSRAVYETLSQTARETQGKLIQYLREKKIKYRAFYIQNAIAVFDIGENIILEIAARQDVKKIMANSKVAGVPRFKIEPLDSEPKGIGNNIKDTAADKFWQEFNVHGENIVIAGSDTGINWQHPAIIRQYRGYNENRTTHDYHWHDAIHEEIEGGSSCGYDNAVPCDDHGHGSHTVGTVVGSDGKENQIGMAPGAKWIGCRNMDNGVGRPSSYIECFEWFLAPYPYHGDPQKDGVPEMAPHVINNSWGCPPSEDCKGAEILPVLKVLKDAGIMVVASAGNEGSSCKTIGDPPAMHSEETLSVGAHSHSSGSIAYFSSRGPSNYDGQIGPDITAPGVSVRSCVTGTGYNSWSGTSMAGPHVVGQVALLWSLDPTLVGQIDETVDLIRKSAKPQTSSQECGGVSGSSIPNNTWGWGKIDVLNAARMRLSR